MNRVPYRRHTPPRSRLQRKNFEKKNAEPKKSETLVTQFAVSGILVTVVMLICLVNIAPFNTAREGLRQVLQGPVTISELTDEISIIRQTWFAPQEEEPVPVYIIPTPNFDTQTQIPIFDTIPLSIEETTAEEDPLKPQAPAPLIIPGLWD